MQSSSGSVAVACQQLVCTCCSPAGLLDPPFTSRAGLLAHRRKRALRLAHQPSSARPRDKRLIQRHSSGSGSGGCRHRPRYGQALPGRSAVKGKRVCAAETQRQHLMCTKLALHHPPAVQAATRAAACACLPRTAASTASAPRTAAFPCGAPSRWPPALILRDCLLGTLVCCDAPAACCLTLPPGGPQRSSGCWWPLTPFS